MKKANTKTTTFIKRGKMVFCLTTHQIFPSATVAAKELGVGYHTVAKTCEGKYPSNKRGLFYIETMADINEIFAAQNAKTKADAKAREEYELLKAKLDEAETYASELRQQMQEVEKMIS